MSKKWRSKPVPGVGDWEKINKSYGGNADAYYQANAGSDDYHGTYHQLANKYGWSHEPAKELPEGTSRRHSDILNQGVESLPPILIGDWHIQINRYNNDDGKVQVLMVNLRTEKMADGTMPMGEIDQFILKNLG